MVRTSAVVRRVSGFHARPVISIVQLADKFKSNIYFQKDDKKVNAKSIIGVLSLEAIKEDKILIIAEGEDEKEAVSALAQLIEEGLTE